MATLSVRLIQAHREVSVFPVSTPGGYQYDVCVPVWATKLPHAYPLRVGKADGTVETAINYQLLPNGHTLITTGNGGEMTKIYGADVLYGKLEDLPKYLDRTRPFWYLLTDHRFRRLEWEKYEVEATALWVGYELHDFGLQADADRHLAFYHTARMLRSVRVELVSHYMIHGAQMEAITGQRNSKATLFVCTLRAKTIDDYEQVQV